MAQRAVNGNHDGQAQEVPSVRVVSFYTPDKYYVDSAKALSQRLARLGVPYYFKAMPRDDENWAEVTTRKISFLQECFASMPEERIVWIDIDSEVYFWPSELNSFSADMIGFTRGSGRRTDIGKYSRFWSPVLLGFKRSPAVDSFLARASEAGAANQDSTITDDFMWQEAWLSERENLSIHLLGPGLHTSSNPAFSFGSSGNVNAYKSKALQHEKPLRGIHSETGVRALLARAAQVSLLKARGLLK